MVMRPDRCPARGNHKMKRRRCGANACQHLAGLVAGDAEIDRNAAAGLDKGGKIGGV